MKMINDIECRGIKRAIKKFSYVKINPDSKFLRGSFKIVNFRKYRMHHEIEIEFCGEISSRLNAFCPRQWYSSEIYFQKNISKIRINRLIKRHLLKEIKSHALYFGINVEYIENIKKITWK